MKTNPPPSIYQFKVTLQGIEPPIWRRIQVPGGYSFWDLHVAIQDAMGWLDYHLHAFRVRRKHHRKLLEIGIPGEEWDDRIVMPGWEVSIGEHFTQPGISVEYEYDFGDSWEHEVLLEGILLKEKGAYYPRCIAAQRAGPPEDCGGVPGYYRLLEIVKNPKDEEYEEMMAWLKGHAMNYYPYESEEYHPDRVHFDNPKKRWRLAFSQHREK